MVCLSKLLQTCTRHTNGDALYMSNARFACSCRVLVGRVSTVWIEDGARSLLQR